MLRFEGIVALVTGAPKGIGAGIAKGLAAARIEQPSDIGRVAVLLASDDASWVTGEIILATRGLH